MTNKVGGAEELEHNTTNTMLESVPTAAVVAATLDSNKTTTGGDDDDNDDGSVVVDDNEAHTTITNVDKMAVEAEQQTHNTSLTPLGESSNNPTEIVQTEYAIAPSVLDVNEHVPHPPLTQEGKIDLVLNKLDDILVRLDRIEAFVTTGDNVAGAGKSLARNGIMKPKMKNTIASAMKSVQETSSVQEINLHFYDNEYHVIPQGWMLPKLNFEGLMQFWYLGDPSSSVPPLIKVGGSEFKNLPRGVRKRSDMKYLMKHVERKGKEIGCFVEDINEWSLDSVRNLFNQTRSYFEYPNKSSTQTKFEKLSWETVCHNLRKNKGLLVGEDPHQEVVVHITDHNVQPSITEATIPVHVSNQNPIAEVDDPNDVVMEEAQDEAAPSDKEPLKTLLV